MINPVEVTKRAYRMTRASTVRSKFLNDLHLQTNDELIGELATEIFFLSEMAREFDMTLLDKIFGEVASRMLDR